MANLPSSVGSQPSRWGSGHSNEKLSISHTGGFAPPLDPRSPAVGDDSDSAALGMATDTNPRSVTQEHRTYVGGGRGRGNYMSPSLSDTTSFGLNTYMNPGTGVASTIDPWTPVGLPHGSSMPIFGPLMNHTPFLLSHQKSNNHHSFQDSGLGTDEPSQFDTRSQLSQQAADMDTQTPNPYPLPPTSHHELEEQEYVEDETEAATEVSRVIRRGSRQGNRSKEELKCDLCLKVLKTPSDLKKHMAGHELPHQCPCGPCKRGDKGFATINDLNRHLKSVHDVQTGTRSFKCFVSGCSKAHKIWPRLDNFKQHLIRVHKDQDVDKLLKLSDDWYNRQHPEDPVQSQAIQNELRTQERNVAEEKKKKKRKLDSITRTPRATTPPPMMMQPQDDGPNKRSRVNEVTGSPKQSPPSAHFSEPHSTSRQQKHAGSCKGSGVTTATQNDADHSQSPPLRVPGLSRAGFQSVPGFLASQPMSRSHSISDLADQGRSHRGFATTLENLPMFPFAGPDVQWNIWQQPDEQLPIPTVPHRGLSILHNNYFGPEMYMAENGMRTEQQACTIAGDFGDLQRLRLLNGLNNQQQHDNDTSWMDSFHLPQSGADFDTTEGNSDLFAVGAVSGTIPHMSSRLIEGHDKLPVAPTIRITDHDVDSRVKNMDNTDLSLIRKLRIILDEYEAKLNSGVGQFIALDSKNQNQPKLKRRILEMLDTQDPDPETPKPASAPFSGDRYPLEDRTCPYCKKVKRLPCDLRKHLKRHFRPYGCVIDNCNKTFGSKNDWRRHEVIHPSQTQCFRCDGQHISPDSGLPCEEVIYGEKEEYCQHLTEAGIPLEMLDKIAESRLIRSNNQKGFWCGFCNKIIRHGYEGLEAMNERLSHIDRHFHMEKKSTSDWVELGGKGKTKLEIEQQQRQKGQEQGQEQDDVEGKTSIMPQDELSSPSSSPELLPPDACQASVMLQQQQQQQQTSQDQRPGLMYHQDNPPNPLQDSHPVGSSRFCCNCEEMFPTFMKECGQCHHKQCTNCRR